MKLPNNHAARVSHTFEDFASHFDPQYRRKARQIWNQHVARHGNVPLITKCTVCSGADHRHDVKVGRFKRSRPTRGERDEARDY